MRLLLALATLAIATVASAQEAARDFAAATDIPRAVAALARLLTPSGLVAVTSTRSVAPTSAVVGSNEALVAPPMFDQVVPSVERCHWNA